MTQTTHAHEPLCLPVCCAALSASEAGCIQHHCDGIWAAWTARDRSALRHAKQQLLDAAYADPLPSPALRSALRHLSWHVAGWLVVHCKPARQGHFY